MWHQGEVPQDFKDATIVHLYKRKRNGQLCDNHRDISLLIIVRNIFARTIPNRLNNHVEQGLLSESQCDFVIVLPPTDIEAEVDRIPDTDVLKLTGILSIYAMIRQSQLPWSGHLRVGYERLPKRLFCGDVTTGSRQQKRQFRRYQDILKTSLRQVQIDPANWDSLAPGRPGAVIYEANRIIEAKAKDQARKYQLRPPRSANNRPPLTCSR
ncbi:hypothetical protein SprV_0301201900 [Sparganum proliferum]